MKASLVLFFLLVALFASSSEAKGQVILDEIQAIGDKVTFEDPLFTNYGVVEGIETNSFAVTRQFELNVDIPDVILDSLTGLTHFSGSQGATVSSLTGDIVFDAENDLNLFASEITAIGTDGLLMQSQTGDITLSSLFPLEVVGGSVSVEGDESLTVFTTGELSFHAGELFNVVSSSAISFTSEELFSLEARTGDVFIGAANEMIFSASENFVLDGTHGVAVSTLGNLDLIAGRSTILTSITADTLVRGDAAIDYTRITLVGDDGVVIGGRRVDLAASGRIIVDSESPGAVISADFGSQLNITAANDITFKSSGETGDVSIFSNSLSAVMGDSFTSNARSLYLGSNSTDSFVVSTAQYFFDSSFLNVRSEDRISVSSVSSTTIDSNDFLIHSNRHTLESDTMANFAASDWNVFNPLGDVNGHAFFSSKSDISFSSDDFVMQGSKVDGKFSSQQYFVEQLTVTSKADEDISFNSGVNMSGLIDDDIIVDTSIFKIRGDSDLTLNLVDFTLNADKVRMFITAATFDASEDATFASSNYFYYSSENASFNSGDELRLTITGTGSVTAADFFFDAGDEVEVIATKTIQMQILEDATLEGGNMDISTGGNLYMKTSEFFISSELDLALNPNSFTGSFGDIVVDSDGDVEITGEDLLDILSGGDITFTVDDSISISPGDDLDVAVQETLSLNAQQNVDYSTGNMLLDGSQEFVFTAGADMSTVADDMNYSSDIFEHTATTFDVTSTNIEINDGTIAVESTEADITVTAADAIFLADISAKIDTRIFALNSGKFTSTSDETNFNSQSQTYSTTDVLSIGTQTLLLDGWRDSLTAATSASFTGSTSVSFETSDDQGIALTSASTLDISAGSDLTLHSDADTSIWADNFIDISAVGNLQFISEISTTITTDNAFDAFASNKIFIDAAEDASFTTEGTGDINMLILDDKTVSVGRDFHILANGLEGDCGINFDTSNGFGFTMESIDGSVVLDSYKDSLISSSTDLEFFAAGNLFMESLNNGLMYFAEGTTAGITITADGGNSADVEFVAVTAGMQLYANQGFNFNAETGRFAAETGMMMTAKQSSAAGPTISYFSEDHLHITGARGVEFRAGLDAPVFDSDINVSSDDIAMESQDLLHMQSISTFDASGDGIGFTTYEGNSISHSAAQDLTVLADNNIEYTTTDGDQTYTANNDNLIVVAGADVDISTFNGPINMDALAGEFLMSGFDWEFTSNMDTRALSLGTITLNTGTDFRLIVDETALFQTARDIDSMIFNGDIISADSSHDGFYRVRDIEILGDNVDIVSDLVNFNTVTSGITFGDESNPIVTIIAGGDAATPGISFISDGAISTSALADISATALTAQFTIGDATDIESFGLISMVAQTGDFNLAAENGVVQFGTAISNFAIAGDHTINADLFAFSQFRLEKEVPIRATDIITISAASDIVATADDITHITRGKHVVDIGGSTFITGDNIYFDYFDQGGAVDPENIERSTMQVNMNNLDTTANRQFQVEFVSSELESNGKMSSGDTFSLDTIDLTIQILGLGAQLAYNSLDTFTATSATTFDIQTFHSSALEPSVEVDADIYIEGNTVEYNAVTDLIVTDLRGTTSFDISGETDFEVIGDLTIDVNDFRGPSTRINLSAHEDVTFNTDSDFSINGVAPFNGLPSIRDEFKISMYSDDILSFVGETISITADTISSFSGDLDINAETSLALTATAGDVLFDSQGLESDISWDAVTTALTFTGTTFDVSAYGGATFTTEGAATIDSVDIDATATFGDIFIESSTVVIASTASSISFTAEGYHADDNRAISFVDGTMAFTSTAGDILVEMNEKFELTSENLMTISGTVAYEFASTGFNSPITLDVLDNAWNLQTAATLDIQAGSVVSFKTNFMDVSAVGALAVRSEFSRSGISFDTDVERNAFASVTFAAADITQRATEVRFENEYDGGVTGGVIHRGTDALTFISRGENINIIGEQGDVVFTAADFSFIPQDDLFIEANDVSIQTTADVINFVGTLTSFRSDGDIRASNEMAGTVFSTPTLTLDTRTITRDNHIAFASGGSLDITVANDFTVRGNGGNGGILIDSDFSSAGSSFTATIANSIDYNTESGIYIAGTQHENPDTSPVQFISDTDAEFLVGDNRGIIFFQSDNDIILTATRIEHVNYATRMGFFSEIPDFIHLVNQQSTEICLRNSWCGFNGRFGNASVPISEISRVAILLQNNLRQFGLISWTQPLV